MRGMKKYVIIVAIGLLTTAGVTASVMGVNNKKTTKKETIKKECTYKKECSVAKSSCY